KLAVEKEQPARVKIRRIKLDIMEEGQAKSEAVRIQYASKHARVSNYWKYFVGQSAQLVKNNVWDKKKKIEDDFDAWANKSEENKKKYGSVIATFDEAHKTLEKYVYGDVYLQEAVFGPDISGFVYGNFGRRATIMPALAEENTEAIQTAKEEIIAAGKEFFKNYNVEIDKNLFVAMMELYYNDVPKEFHPEKLTYYHNKCKGNWRKLADKYYSKSPFTSQEKLEDWLSDVDAKTIESDMVYQLMSDFINTYVQKILMPKGAAEGNMGTAKRLFIDGLRTMNADKVYAPDANSTMRITYGQVLAYDAKDGVTYKNQTTLDGVMEKDANTNDVFHEFYVHDKLKELYKAKDYGQYGEDGVLYVGFLSNNDITGGNSGSPVINGNGELIGCAFDGNWEAMSGDIYFEPNIQRTISVDIRYVLFVVDKYAGAGHLVKEMTLVKGPKKPLKKKVVSPKEVQMLAPQN
ncbi:MAG: serine protease, partial [Crocinitomicaceae bacterium]|nr:serine protease [Crocinitomicaceae bacterium]